MILMEIIPERLIPMLPFSPEAISKWTDETDLINFLSNLYDKSGKIISSDGTVREINYRDYGEYVFKLGRERFEKIAKEFEENANKLSSHYHGKEQIDTIPDFAEDEHFGSMSKYAIAWDGVIGEALSESAFYSIEHVLESDEELKCSILLASNLYYKQALQILRNYLEILTMELYFCHEGGAYDRWKEGSFKNPPLRGKSGILRYLVDNKILAQDEANSISELYAELNGCIHGKETRLIHAGIFEGRGSGKNFKYSKFQELCNLFSKCVDSGIRILRDTINLNLNRINSSGIQCDICHSFNDFMTIERSSFGGKYFTKIKCTKCGNEMHIDQEYASRYGF